MTRIFILGLVFSFGAMGCAHHLKTTPQKSSHDKPKAHYSKQASVSPETESSQKAPIRSVFSDSKSQKPASLLNLHNPSSNAITPHEPPASNGSHNGFAVRSDIQSHLDKALEYCDLSQELWQKGDLEQALVALDQAYELLLQIDESHGSEALQQKEDLRFTVSKRILEIYASRTIVLNGDHKAIPVNLNPHVLSEIRSFTSGGEKDFFQAAYTRSGKYMSFITKALEQAGLPIELAWLPLIESGFKSNALSPARALGLWQFIPSTGYKFGLTRNKYIDERLDFEKSTHAAIAYLKELHELFGDWETVLAAYNCGEGRVLRTIRSQNINYLDNFWDLYEKLPNETARYVPRFIAVLHIVNNKEKYGIDQLVPAAPLTYDTVEINQQAHLKDVGSRIGVPECAMQELNPELRYNILPEETYTLRVPAGFQEVLLASLDDIPPYEAPKPTAYAMRNDRNDADRHSKKVTKTQRASSKAKVHSKPREKRPTTSTHVVKKGDSLYNLAKRYGTTARKIQQLSSLKTTKLNIGQKLKVPAPPVSSTASVSKKARPYRQYKVRNGDSPVRIASLHKMKLNRFLKINQLTPRSKIFPGQTLYVER